MSTTDESRDTFRRILAENGVGQPGSSIHSWRCEYPDRYGARRCVEELLDDLVAAQRPEWEVRAEAWDEGHNHCFHVEDPRNRERNPYRPTESEETE